MTGDFYKGAWYQNGYFSLLQLVSATNRLQSVSSLKRLPSFISPHFSDLLFKLRGCGVGSLWLL
jgi:hypothetical protein